MLRAESRRKGKFFVQIGFNDVEDAELPWPLVRFPAGASKPAYGLEDVPIWLDSGGTRVLIVEGEKTRDCAAGLLPIRSTGILVLSNMGGCNAASQADWSPFVDAIKSRGELAEPVEVIVWPDADKPIVRPNGEIIDVQAAYAKSLERSLASAARATRAGRVEFKFWMVEPPSGVKPGWDLADACIEGWTREQVLKKIDRNGTSLELNERSSSAPSIRRISEPRSPCRLEFSEPSAIMPGTHLADKNALIPRTQSSAVLISFGCVVHWPCGGFELPANCESRRKTFASCACGRAHHPFTLRLDAFVQGSMKFAVEPRCPASFPGFDTRKKGRCGEAKRCNGPLNGTGIRAGVRGPPGSVDGE